MAINFSDLGGGGGGRTDLVYSQGAHTVNIAEGFYIVDVSGGVTANGAELASGFQKLPNVTSLDVGLTNLDGWREQTTPTSADQDKVTFGNSLWVSVGSENITSPDGVTWTLRTAPRTGRDIKFADGIFVLVGSGGVETSTDGITWTNRITGFPGTFFAVDYDPVGDLWVIGDQYGNIRTSPDAITWTSYSDQNGGFDIFAIVYGDGLWVAGGDAGSMITSPDGATWTSRTSTFGSNDIQGLAFGNSLYVAVGNSGTIATSPDGISWTSRTSGTSAKLNSVKYLDNEFVVAGQFGIILTSSDGIVWTTRTTPTSDELRDADYNGTDYVAVGAGGVAIKAGPNPDAGALITSLPTAIAP